MISPCGDRRSTASAPRAESPPGQRGASRLHEQSGGQPGRPLSQPARPPLRDLWVASPKWECLWAVPRHLRATGVLGKLPGQQRGAVFEAHHGARRFGAACWLLAAVARGGAEWVRRGRPRCLCGAGEPVGQHGGGGLPREPWIGAVEPVRQTFDSPCPPRDGRPCPCGRESSSHGSRSRPVCRAGYLEEGRQGVRPGRRGRSAQDGRDGHDLGLDDQPDPGAA